MQISGRISYEPIGLTRTGEYPAGFQPLEREVLLGYGETTFVRVEAALYTWQIHRAAGLRVRATSSRAEVGVRVSSALGVRLKSGATIGISAPCEVVWTGAELGAQVFGVDRTSGFGYGTLLGHPEQGEECFVVRMAADGRVSFHLRAYSRVARPWLRPAGPMVRRVQDVITGRYLRAAQSIAAGA